MNFSKAAHEQLATITALADRCREALNAQGIWQWDEHYPTRAFFDTAYAEGGLFVLTDAASGNDVQGIAVLNQSQGPHWETVAWQDTTGSFLVLHSFAVTPSAQNQGYGGMMLRQCEAYARDHGHTSIRLDAFSGNTAAVRFYERRGYARRGEIAYPFKPAGQQTYYFYEKSLIPATSESSA